MKKYKVFLSNSQIAIGRIEEAYHDEFVADKPENPENAYIVRITCGPCRGGACTEAVPQIYHNKGYYMCCVVYGEDAPVPPYELIFYEV